jgi:SAM-dependent methyltransferase
MLFRMGERRTRAMRRYWDERARLNAPYYVDTSLPYDAPDMERFFETGRIVVRTALDDAPVQPAGRRLAVEIGSGIGRVSRALADRFEEVVGVDISAEMVDRARALVDRPGLRFEVGSGAELGPVESGVADFVVSFQVFQHIPRVAVIERYIAEAGRVLRPGGVFALQWNNSPGHRRWVVRRGILSLLQRTGIWGDRYQRNASEFLGSRVSLARIERALASAGLTLAGTSEEGTLFTWAWATKP